MKRKEQLILVRGGGDIASGTIYKLLQCGYSVLVLETEMPSAIRRYAAFSEAVYDGVSRVEDKTCRLAGNFREARKIMETGEAAMLVDPDCRVLKEACPFALVDAILAKKNLGPAGKWRQRPLPWDRDFRREEMQIWSSRPCGAISLAG